MSLMDKDVVLTTKEATKYLKISKPTLLKYIRLGRTGPRKQETAGGSTNTNYIVS